MKPGTILLTAFLICGFQLFTSCSSETDRKAEKNAKPKKPNVIIILSDDQGWRDVSFNGSTDINTPHLDELAHNGVIFSQGYAAHPYCSPSRAGLLTGRYQQRFGHECNIPYKDNIDDLTVGLPLTETMLPEVFQKNGYKTCAIGKWHLGENKQFWPINRGFDYWYGFLGGGLSYWGDTGNKPEYMGVMRNGEIVPQDELSYLTDDFTREAVGFIERNKDEPFFMYLAYNAPHGPFQATREYLEMTDYIEEGDRAVYAAMVKAMDQGVGRVKEKLQEHGLLENTLVVYYSDNGGHGMGSDNSPYRGKKGMLFEGGIRVPFMLSWPAGIEGGKTYQHPVIGLDVFPTALSAAGIDIPAELELDGVNLLPFLKDEDPGPPHVRLFWRYSGGEGYAVRDGNYKLIREEVRQDTFLFDMEKDPFEMNNIREVMPEKEDELQALYEEWSKGTIQPAWLDPHLPNVIATREARQAVLKAACRGEKK